VRSAREEFYAPNFSLLNSIAHFVLFPFKFETDKFKQQNALRVSRGRKRREALSGFVDQTNTINCSCRGAQRNANKWMMQMRLAVNGGRPSNASSSFRLNFLKSFSKDEERELLGFHKVEASRNRSSHLDIKVLWKVISLEFIGFLISACHPRVPLEKSPKTAARRQ
jgi:hypothetical protein